MKFVNNKKNLMVIITKKNVSPNITIRVNIEDNKKIFMTSFNADVRNIFVHFFDVNNDSLDDVFLELSDESGFSPFILVNNKNLTFVESFSPGEYYVDYSNLESENADEYNDAYKFVDIDSDNIKEIKFHHLYHNKSYFEGVVFKINKELKFFLLKQ